MPRAREREGRECSSGNRPLHQIHPGICNMIADCPNESYGPLTQFHYTLWPTLEDPFQPGEEL